MFRSQVSVLPPPCPALPSATANANVSAGDADETWTNPSLVNRFPLPPAAADQCHTRPTAPTPDAHARSYHLAAAPSAYDPVLASMRPPSVHHDLGSEYEYEYYSNSGCGYTLSSSMRSSQALGDDETPPRFEVEINPSLPSPPKRNHPAPLSAAARRQPAVAELQSRDGQPQPFVAQASQTKERSESTARPDPTTGRRVLRVPMPPIWTVPTPSDGSPQTSPSFRAMDIDPPPAPQSDRRVAMGAQPALKQSSTLPDEPVRNGKTTQAPKTTKLPAPKDDKPIDDDYDSDEWDWVQFEKDHEFGQPFTLNPKPSAPRWSLGLPQTNGSKLSVHTTSRVRKMIPTLASVEEGSSAPTESSASSMHIAPVVNMPSSPVHPRTRGSAGMGLSKAQVSMPNTSQSLTPAEKGKNPVSPFVITARDFATPNAPAQSLSTPTPNPALGGDSGRDHSTGPTESIGSDWSPFKYDQLGDPPLHSLELPSGERRPADPHPVEVSIPGQWSDATEETSTASAWPKASRQGPSRSSVSGNTAYNTPAASRSSTNAERAEGPLPNQVPERHNSKVRAVSSLGLFNLDPEPGTVSKPWDRESTGSAQTIHAHPERDLAASGGAPDHTRVSSLAEFRQRRVWDNGKEHDRPTLELVLNLVVTCSAVETPYPRSKDGQSKDGKRTEVWPIVGGRFDGRAPSFVQTDNRWIGGEVIPGGADLPYVQPDGTEVVDAFYRLRTDDGTMLILHNKGLVYPAPNGGEEKYRLLPTFIAPADGPYSWLNQYIFVASLVDVPKHLARARPDKGENDRMIQVYCIV